MRKSLLDSFNTIYLLNLHGSSRRTEAVPEAERDENVFDIIQGVCYPVVCQRKRQQPVTSKGLLHGSVGKSREEKYNTLSETDVQSTEWCELQPTSSYHLFVPQATLNYSAEYEAWMGNYQHLFSYTVRLGLLLVGID